MGRPSLAASASSQVSDIQRVQVSAVNQINFRQMEERNLPSKELVQPSKEQLSGNADKLALPYACEDCGQRFPDAPSRNRHQTLQHYSLEEQEKEDTGSSKTND